MENRSIGDQDIGLHPFRNKTYPGFRSNQPCRHFRQRRQCRGFRQSVPHAGPHRLSNACRTVQTVRGDGKLDARRVNPRSIRRRQFPVLQLVQSHQSTRVRIAHIVRLGIIQAQHHRCANRLQLIKSLVGIVSGDQNEVVVHHVGHDRSAQSVFPSSGIEKRRQGPRLVERFEREVGFQALIQSAGVSVPVRVKKRLLQQSRRAHQ